MYDKIYAIIHDYEPQSEQENAEKNMMLDLMGKYDDLLLRKNLTAHFTPLAGSLMVIAVKS